MYKTLAFDVETTIFQKGNPFSQRNKLVLGGFYDGNKVQTWAPDEAPKELAGSKLVTFNGKFDLHWARRIGINLEDVLVWDVQLAHFMLMGQAGVMPSLEEVAEYYGFPGKIDVVKTEYWEKDIDTDKIPIDILTEYLTQDLKLTWQIYQRQQEEFRGRPKLYNLFLLDCRDLLILAEMEWNGLRWNSEASLEEGKKVEEEILEIEEELKKLCPGVPINFNSPFHISALLFGGTIVEEAKRIDGFYKTGKKAGEAKLKKYEIEHTLKGFLKPDKKNELATPGYYSTNEKILRKYKHKAITLLLERAHKSKLLDYLKGIPELIEEKDWPPNHLHGQFNQTVARTGRLSSSQPNLQNIDTRALKFVESRYA